MLKSSGIEIDLIRLSLRLLKKILRGIIPVIKKKVIFYFSAKAGGVSGRNTNAELSW